MGDDVVWLVVVEWMGKCKANRRLEAVILCGFKTG